MWVNPKYKDQFSCPEPPPEHGVKLAEIPRGRDTVLRVNLQEWEGRPFVSLRLWQRGSDNHMWPVKGKGISIRISELPDMIACLRSAEDLADRPAPEATATDDRPTFVDKQAWRRRHREALELPATPAGDGDRFDEFHQGQS